MKIYDRKSLVSQVMIIFLLSNIFVVAIFTIYITEKDRRATVENLESSMQTIAQEKAGTLSLALGQVVRETETFADFAQEYIADETDEVLSDSYRKKEDGVLYRRPNSKLRNQEYSAVFLPANASLNSDMIQILNGTEKLDPFMASMQKRNPSIQWNYIATEEGMLRVLPYSSIDVYDRDHLQKRDPFYTIANEQNNPQRKPVWSVPYVDYLGTGWMITCSAPLYRNDHFMGIVSSDVRLDVIQKEFLEDFRLGEEGFVYLLDEEGNILYHPTIAMEEGKQGETFLTNIVTDTNFSKSYKDALKTVISEKNGIVSYSDEKKRPHMIAYAEVDRQPWIIAVEINQSRYLQINDLSAGSWWKFLLLLAAGALLLLYFLHRQFSKPFHRLTAWAESIAEGNFDQQTSIRNYTEMATLSDTFNFMSAKIKDFTSSLVKKNKEIQNVIDGIGGLMMILNPDMEIMIINQRAADALSMTKEEIQGRKCYELLAGQNHVCGNCAAKQSIEARTVQFSRIILHNQIFQNTYYPLPDTEEVLNRIIVQSQKITKKVMLEEEVSRNKKMSEIGQLTAAIAHELKNPLAIIKGSSYLLSAYAENYHEAVNESIKTIIQSTEHAEDVVFNLLDYSRPASADTSQGDIKKIVDQVVLLTNRDRIRNSVEILTEFQTYTLEYRGNMEPLKHIFMNLVTNAIHAMKDGGMIKIGGGYETSNEGCIILTIEDDGPGIPREWAGRVFEPFVTSDRSGVGTGMGLWITKIMVEKMQGTIEMQTEEGKGTKFTIRLPEVHDERGTEDGNQR